MLSRSLIAAAFAGMATAQAATTVSAYLPMNGGAGLVASVVAVEDGATTYAFGCPGDIGEEGCGYPAGGDYTVIDSPSSVSFGLIYDDITMEGSCTMKGDMATCTGDHRSGTFNIPQSTTQAVSDMQPQYATLTVTAGAELLAKPTGGPEPTGSIKPTGSVQPTGSSEPSQAASGGAAKPTGDDKGAGSRLVAGSALAVIAAALLI